MSQPRATPASWLERFPQVAYWITPPLLAIWFHWLGLKTWFFADDFAWLTHATEFSNFRGMVHAIFMPMAQGTIRPWSDRIFFMAFYHVFGLDPLPFHICILLTQCANVLLLLAIARRMTGSRLAGFAAALLWTANTSQPTAIGWTSAYNQPMCGLFILGAFYFLLRWLETGERRYWILQWVVFILGFGALELNVVYPVLAAGYTLCCARKHFRRTLPLFLVSIAFAVAHRLATGITSGIYQPHFGLGMLKTLWTYWTWTLGPAFLAPMMRLPAWEVTASTLLLTFSLVLFVAASAWKRDLLPLFLLFWYVVLIAPVLPLADHLTEYYPFLPAIGFAMLGGLAIARAWNRSVLWKAAAVALALIYFGFSVPASRRTSRWQYETARDVRKLVLGVERAHELHPEQAILLDGVDDLLFWRGVLDSPFLLVGAYSVYLTPGEEKQIQPRPELGNLSDFIIAPGPAWHALVHDQAVVYSARGERLRNITSIYIKTLPEEWEALKPQRVAAADLAEAYLLGPTWHKIEGNHRWMPRRASVLLAGPRAPGARLHLIGIPAPTATRLTVTVDGVRLPEKSLVPGAEFDVEWSAPAAAVGKPSVEVEIEVDRAITPPIDGRELGAAFGVIEFR